MPARRVAWIAVGLLVLTAAAIVAWEPWHGPIVLTLSFGHGIDAGDLVVVPLLTAAASVGWRLTVARGTVPPAGARRRSRGVGAAAAAALGLLLLAVGILDLGYGGPLLPAGGGTFEGEVLYAGAGSSSPVDEWTHLAVTYDGSTLRLFVDGRRVASRAVPGGHLEPTALPVWIGGNQPYGEYFDGVIDEVRIYGRALTPAELEADGETPIVAHIPSAADPSSLVAAYSFDEGAGDVADDLSGEGNIGELMGAQWTPDGRFGGALRFDGSHSLVRVAPSPSLDLSTGMTLSAWVKPASEQSGWRTIVQRQVDAYFLDASSARQDRLGRLDDVVAGLVVLSAVWLCAITVRSRGAWLGDRRRAWLVGVALTAVCIAVDMLLAPSGTLVAPALIALWLAATATDWFEVAVFGVLAAGYVAASGASLQQVDVVGLRLSADDGGAARAAALGLLLIVTGVLRALAADRRADTGSPTEVP